MIALRQLPHTYKNLYHAFSQQPSHHKEGIGRDGRSTHMGGEKEGAEADDLEADEFVLGMVKEATGDKEKEI